jgi:deoxyadenosine/deoxycytidine kinase
VKSKIFVAVAGNIGTGKTTLTQMLSRRFGWTPHFESVTNNPYLSDFYADMGRWSFPLQIFFLNHRFKAHQQISQSTDSAIQDRSIYEDASIFARNLYEGGQMEERDFQNYLNLYEVLCGFLTPPDLILYLRKSLPCLKRQIQLRGRDYEKSIPDRYLEDLNRFYDDWMQNYSLGHKLIIDSDGLDFVARPEDFEKICSQILESLDQRDLFLGTAASARTADVNPVTDSVIEDLLSPEFMRDTFSQGLATGVSTPLVELSRTRLL